MVPHPPTMQLCLPSSKRHRKPGDLEGGLGLNVRHTAQKQPTEPTVTRHPGKLWESKACVSCRQGQPSPQEGDRPCFWGRGLPWILNGHQISIPHSTAAAFLKRFTKSF